MNFNVKWCYKKQISLLLDCYLLTKRKYYNSRIIQHLKIILCHFNLYSFNFGKVKESIQDGTYAKLTLAKTIGDTELKTSIRPVLLENDVFSLHLALSTKQKN
jgi:hypothetical protein